MLLENGRDAGTPAAFIHWGTTDRQNSRLHRRHAFRHSDKRRNQNPSLIVIGDVVNYHCKLDWYASEQKNLDLSEAL